MQMIFQCRFFYCFKNESENIEQDELEESCIEQVDLEEKFKELEQLLLGKTYKRGFIKATCDKNLAILRSENLKRQRRLPLQLYHWL